MQFRAFTADELAAAVGPGVGMPEVLRRALESSLFAPLPPPGPNDWLANHAESGQTFEDFVAHRPNLPNEKRRKLYLLPLRCGDPADAVPCGPLQDFAAAFFMTEVVTLPAVDLLTERRIKRRNHPFCGQLQLYTVDILNFLHTRLPGDGFALLGITMVDLYPGPNWNFVFGQACVRDCVGVYSLARYDPAFYGGLSGKAARATMLRRSMKVLAHETCHLLGIEHCIWYRCLMNGSNHIDEADARPMHLCPVDLRKLQFSVKFDVIERYRRLREFHAKAGFEDEAGWVEQRLRAIETGM